MNNATKVAKKRYFSENFETRKAIHVKLGIVLTSLAHGLCSCKSPNILEIQLEANNRTVNNADDMRKLSMCTSLTLRKC